MILKVSRFIAPSLSSLPLETFCHIAVSDFQTKVLSSLGFYHSPILQLYPILEHPIQLKVDKIDR